MTKKLLIAIIVGLYLVPCSTFGQSQPEPPVEKTEPALTALERSEARAFVQNFCTNLTETHSVTPLWDQFFAADFGPSFGRDMLREISAEQGDEARATQSLVFQGLDDETSRRMAAGILDMLYLVSVLESIRKNDPNETDHDEQTLMETISPRARTLIESDQRLAGIFGENGEDDIKLTSAKEILDFLDVLETAEAILREDISGRASPQFVSAQCGEDLADTLENIQLFTSDREEHRRPAGTRFITAELPIGFQLALANDGSGFRIVGIQFGD